VFIITRIKKLIFYFHYFFERFTLLPLLIGAIGILLDVHVVPVAYRTLVGQDLRACLRAATIGIKPVNKTERGMDLNLLTIHSFSHRLSSLTPLKVVCVLQ